MDSGAVKVMADEHCQQQHPQHPQCHSPSPQHPYGEATEDEGAKSLETTGDIAEHPDSCYQPHKALGDGPFPVLLSDLP
jgi:hypothetical protein